MSKLSFCMLISLPITGIVEFVDAYIYNDWEFARFLVTLIIVDTVLSVIKHLLHKDASSEDFWKGTSKKVFVYMVLLIVANVMSNFNVNGHHVSATAWMGDYLCVAMLVREAISIIENSNAIYPWLPVKVLKRLKDFGEDGEYINRRHRGYDED